MIEDLRKAAKGAKMPFAPSWINRSVLRWSLLSR